MRKVAYGSDLTGRQKEVLEFIKRTVAADGFPPTRTELAEHFGWSSPNAADEHIRALERKGAITITKGAARGITVAGAAAPAARAVEEEVKAWRQAFPGHHFDLETGSIDQACCRHLSR